MWVRHDLPSDFLACAEHFAMVGAISGPYGSHVEDGDVALPMKTLLFDLTSLDAPSRRRGMGSYLRELARGLSLVPAESLGGLRILGLTHLDWTGAYRIVEDLGSFEGSPSIPSPGPRDHYRWAYRRRLSLWKAVKSLDVDAVHLGDPHATPLFMGLTKCRRIVTCHDLIPVRYPARYMGPKDGGVRIGVAIERRRYHSADLVVAISKATREDLCSLLDLPADRSVQVYNGVDVDSWAAPAPAYAKSQLVLERHELVGRNFVLYVGGCDWHKNIEGMISGLAAARKQGVDLRLAWAAYLRPDQLVAHTLMARKAGVEDAVQFLGYVPDEDLRVLFCAAIAHILVSRAEGFGLTVIEAQASGCPVLTTNGGSLGEVAGDAALKIEPEDSTAIGAALVRLYSDSTLRAQLAALGRAHAPLFSRARQAEAMVKVYRDFLGV
jgi:glycosyltransferase involved in cell wall biosynthesis